MNSNFITSMPGHINVAKRSLTSAGSLFQDRKYMELTLHECHSILFLQLIALRTETQPTVASSSGPRLICARDHVFRSTAVSRVPTEKIA